VSGKTDHKAIWEIRAEVSKASCDEDEMNISLFDESSDGSMSVDHSNDKEIVGKA
jgi:hypothetical protein